MKFYSSKTIRQKIQSLSLFLVLTTAVLGMTTTLAFSLRMEYDNLDRNLMNSALVLAQSPDVADVLAGRSDGEVLTDYLNGTISRVQDIDAIVVADTSGTIVYSPAPSYVGTTYPDLDNLMVLHGQDSEVDTGAGISGVEHRGSGRRPRHGRHPAWLCVRRHRGAQRQPDGDRYRSLLFDPLVYRRQRGSGPLPPPLLLH